MTLREKIKVNLDYLRGKADPKLYAKPYKNSVLKSEEWRKRWKIFSDNKRGFVWFGVDAEGNIAEFCGELAYIPEVFFQDVEANCKVQEFFESLPETTTTKIAENLRLELKESAENSLITTLDDFFLTGANTGLFIFEEAEDMLFGQWFEKKPPYELFLMPDKSVKIYDLPDEIQKLLEPYRFENLNFEDCQFLDVSNHLYCEN